VQFFLEHPVVKPGHFAGLVEQGLTSNLTQSMFLQVRWPNQQCQSTEGGWLVFQIALDLTRLISPCYNNTFCRVQCETPERCVSSLSAEHLPIVLPYLKHSNVIGTAWQLYCAPRHAKSIITTEHKCTKIHRTMYNNVQHMNNRPQQTPQNLLLWNGIITGTLQRIPPKRNLFIIISQLPKAKNSLQPNSSARSNQCVPIDKCCRKKQHYNFVAFKNLIGQLNTFVPGCCF